VQILEKIPVHLDAEGVLKKLHIDKKANKKGFLDYSNIIQELVEIANSVIEAKAIYRVSYVEDKNENTIDIDGVRFTSHVLRVNLDKVGRVFPYIITIGNELEKRADSFDSLIKQYCLGEIGDEALNMATGYIEGYLKREYQLGQISSMHPGSLKGWPIHQQKELFSLFDNVEDSIGVTLTNSLVMNPRKSLSGISFPTEVKFYSCQLCPRERCDERKAPYDKKLEEKYGTNSK